MLSTSNRANKPNIISLYERLNHFVVGGCIVGTTAQLPIVDNVEEEQEEQELRQESRQLLLQRYLHIFDGFLFTIQFLRFLYIYLFTLNVIYLNSSNFPQSRRNFHLSRCVVCWKVIIFISSVKMFFFSLYFSFFLNIIFDFFADFFVTNVHTNKIFHGPSGQLHVNESDTQLEMSGESEKLLSRKIFFLYVVYMTIPPIYHRLQYRRLHPLDPSIHPSTTFIVLCHCFNAAMPPTTCRTTMLSAHMAQLHRCVVRFDGWLIVQAGIWFVMVIYIKGGHDTNTHTDNGIHTVNSSTCYCF